MSLRELAAADNKAIVENPDEFGWPLTITNPEGVAANVRGLSSDVHLMLQVDTGENSGGQMLVGQRAHVSLVESTLIAAGMGTPRGITSEHVKPWLVRFPDINGRAETFKISETHPDKVFGLIVCVLETYRT